MTTEQSRIQHFRAELLEAVYAYRVAPTGPETSSAWERVGVAVDALIYAATFAADAELLEALKLAMPALEVAATHHAGINRVRAARAAIRRATGEQA